MQNSPDGPRLCTCNPEEPPIRPCSDVCRWIDDQPHWIGDPDQVSNRPYRRPPPP